jgi:DNA-binding transcriptional ArsR family regulator
MGIPFNEKETDKPPKSVLSGANNPVTPFRQLQALLPNNPRIRTTEDHMQSLISARRGRERLFGRHLFSDPAWDVIIELYAAMLGKRRMSAADLARAIGAPEPVIGRWIAALVEAGIVATAGDQDGTNARVELTEDGAAKMAQLTDQWTSAFVTI